MGETVSESWRHPERAYACELLSVHAQRSGEGGVTTGKHMCLVRVWWSQTTAVDQLCPLSPSPAPCAAVTPHFSPFSLFVRVETLRVSACALEPRGQKKQGPDSSTLPLFCRHSKYFFFFALSKRHDGTE